MLLEGAAEQTRIPGFGSTPSRAFNEREVIHDGALILWVIVYRDSGFGGGRRHRI
jgi:hypothetical protein